VLKFLELLSGITGQYMSHDHCSFGLGSDAVDPLGTLIHVTLCIDMYTQVSIHLCFVCVANK